MLRMTKENAGSTYAADILQNQLTAERTVLSQTDQEMARLQNKRGETANRITFLESAIAKLGAGEPEGEAVERT